MLCWWEVGEGVREMEGAQGQLASSKGAVRMGICNRE
jgi:hypothetical protein